MIVRERIQRSDGSIKYRNYLKQERLGSGGFAECFLVEREEDKKHYALKIIPKKLLSKPKAQQKMKSQIKIHRTAKHKNICELERAFQDDDNVYMLLQLCRNRNMFELIKRRKKLTIPETQYFIYQLIDALCYLHNKQIVHRDVKLGNLLINSEMNLKLADFGLATKIEFPGDRKHTVCGTPNYIAPEIIMSSLGMGHSGHSYEVDAWSTGVIMYLMLIGRAPFETAKVEKTYARITKAQFSFPDSFKDESAKDLLRRILVVDVQKRYTFNQILNHPFMNPKVGIPRQLPPTSMVSAPKFGIFQKYSQEEVKRSAKNASSVSTIKSAIDVSLLEDLPNSSNYQNSSLSQTDREQKEGSSFAQKSKEKRGLLRSILTSSISKSLDKLNKLARSTSPHVRMKSNQDNEISSDAISRISLTDNKVNAKKQSQPKEVYITKFQREIITIYQLSNGLIGTYESQNNYKLLYNPYTRIFYEINQTNIKKIKHENASTNENVFNRAKYIENYLGDNPLQLYQEGDQMIYLKRLFQVKSENLILFKFSNDDIQTLNYSNNYSLLMGEQMLTLLQLNGGREVSRISQKKEKYSQCKNKMLISMYLTTKKILYKISNYGKQ